MKQKLILLDLVLLAAIGYLGWRVRQTWLEAREREKALLARTVKPQPAPPYVAIPPPAGSSAMAYAEVAQKLLLSKDRNPTVIIVTPPPKQRPALPFAHGYMNMGEPQVLLSAKANAPQKIYKAGDTIGDFKILAVDRAGITFEWDGKPFQVSMADLRPKEAPQPVPASATGGGAAPAPAPTTSSNTLGDAGKAEPGASMGGEQKACNAGDTSPSGTIKDGYKKVVKPNPFGGGCWWEPVGK